jgi:hypothetical protein
MLGSDIIHLVEFRENDFKGLNHLLHLGGSGGEVKTVLSSDFSESVILSLEDLDLSLLLIDFSLVNIDGLIQSLGLELCVLDLIN